MERTRKLDFSEYQQAQTVLRFFEVVHCTTDIFLRALLRYTEGENVLPMQECILLRHNRITGMQYLL